MKSLFTVHEGEFLVGDYINRKLGRMFDVWVPSKDSGLDLLVTRKRREGKPVRLQVKFSRSFDIREEFARHVVATSWFRLEPSKIRKSGADVWVADSMRNILSASSETIESMSPANALLLHCEQDLCYISLLEPSNK